MAALKVLVLFTGNIAPDTKWYEWVIGAILIIVIGFPLIMFLTFLFHLITGVWPV
jgi:hypothetical protein